MRTRRILWGFFALAGLAAIIAIGSQVPQLRAQAIQRNPARPEQQRGQTDRMNRDRQGRTSLINQDEERCKASDLIGMDLRGVSGDDEIGSISDMVISQDGRIEYVAVSFGGLLGMGDKLFAVPFEAIEFVKSDDDAYARVDVTKESLKQKKGFNQDTWPAEADRSFTSGKLRQQAQSDRSW